MKKLFILLCMACSLCHAQSVKIDISKAVSADISSESMLNNIREITVNIPDDVKSKYYRVWPTKDKNKLVIDDLWKHIWIFDIEKKNLNEVEIKGLEKDELSYNFDDKSAEPFQRGLNSEFDSNNDLFIIDFRTYCMGVNVKSGEIVKRIQKPKEFQERLSSCQTIDASHYVSYVNSSSKDKTASFIIFNQEGEILYKKNVECNLTIGTDQPYFSGDFYEYKSDYYCHAPYDGATVYRVAGTELISCMEFVAGEKPQPVTRVIETDHYVYFCFYDKDNQFCLGRYDKQDKTTCLNQVRDLHNHSSLPKAYENRAVSYRQDGNRLHILIGDMK